MDIRDISNELLARASHGDKDACETIYRAAAGFVYNVSLRVAGNREDAEEITQETFLKIFDGLKHFGFRSSFKTWAYRIAVNTALNARKRTAHNYRGRVELDENTESAGLSENPVDRAADARHSEETVARLLEGLSTDQRLCVVLRDMQGLSYEEIAQTLNININTVRSRLKRARESMLRKGKEHELQRM